MTTSLSAGQEGGAAALPFNVTWMMHYAPRPRLLYLVQPKVACSTIKLTLQNAQLGLVQEGSSEVMQQRIHAPTEAVLWGAPNVEELAIYVSEARLRFCFVRNPYSRVLSAFLDKIGHEEIRPMFLEKLGVPEGDRTRSITFADFLDLVARQAPEDMDSHWRPQTYLYDRLEPLVGFDFIGAFETFDADFRTGLGAADPGLLDYIAVFDPHATRAASQVRMYLADSHARRRVEEIYAQDFERFGYAMDPEKVSEPPQLERWRHGGIDNRRVQ